MKILHYYNLLNFKIYGLVHACEWKLCRKVDNDKISSRTHKKQDMLYGKPFKEKTQLEGEATSLSFSIWKYDYSYKEVMSMACGLL